METIGRQLLLLRPRRFGKSLWLSTLEHYYDLAHADEFETLFGHLAIGRGANRAAQPLLHHEMELLPPWTPSAMPRPSAMRFTGISIAKLPRLSPATGINSPVGLRIQDDALASFRSLLAAVGQSPHALYLLIDEYDNFANEVLVSRDRGEDRYNALVGGEGVIKTLFKVVKMAAEGGALERVFITGGHIYNPTLALYFFEHLAKNCCYPDDMLDNNLAMDRNRIEYIAQLPQGDAVVTGALDPGEPLTVEKLERRFGVDRMLRAPQTESFLASLLYFFGVLTYGGRGPLRELRLVIPNLVVRKLYVERIQESLLPGFDLDRERRSVCNRFYGKAEMEPVCRFIEQRFLPVFDNRDLRWSNELVVKTAFLVTLFDDLGYIMDSETAVGPGYCDLSMIVRPDARAYAFLDHVIEFKHLRLADLPDLDSRAACRAAGRATARAPGDRQPTRQG